ncbi:MAG: CDP-2,3-bis-(O-geranylgeranyl)-sn-glycerol synthase [Candidatus Micrarchaeota archaeon]|nr:CDP-2,3-bis-(O-geranylgeranyl)-sn-glycerol synthase [Candidatus Micrarchaeota archaeon]MDE1834801.1 CDP-2,3-bis-(O-geranylgeranyl)-sn-glycerol synthase [Candidatus Micrarchaeota archaeon]MDE1859581.1 CDP-2,3-bis-(O-geranylgeranyl)-sn-glycerol synthase [Candidatus Micrarchaeota archaeon]
MDSNLLYMLILYPIFFIFPAYCANGAPVVFGGGKPLDFGVKFRGKPLLGKHKTIKGLISGLSSGIIIGFAQSLVPGYSFMLVIGAVQGIGAMAGDLVGSFIKRRQGMKEGSKAGLMDQYLFLVFAFLFSIPFGNLPSTYGIIVIFLLTGILHKLTNTIAHRWRIKDVPW